MEGIVEIYIIIITSFLPLGMSLKQAQSISEKIGFSQPCIQAVSTSGY